MNSAIEELGKSRELLFSSFSSGKVSETFHENYTEIFDHYFRKSLQESTAGHEIFKEKNPFAVVALGGYGRGELSVHSDLDVLILFDPKVPLQAKELVNDLLFPLWDLGLDLGYGIRTIKDCLSLCQNDFQVLSSMLDARFVCGDSPLYLSLIEKLEKKLVPKKATAFARWLQDQDKIRVNTFGDASYLLEPHLKEGIGGLRDYHHILWLAKSFFRIREPRDLEYLGKFSHGEYKNLRIQLNFVWLVRNQLHQLCGRRNDRLRFEYQEKIALRLGFEDQKDFQAVEQFMGRLHASMASIKSLHRSFVNTHLHKKQQIKGDFRSKELSSVFHCDQGEIDFSSATAILSDPFLLMEVFQYSSRLKCPLSTEAKRLVREFLYLVDDAFRKSAKALQGFLNIMNGENTFEALDQMFETGFLDAYIPEFGLIKDRVQFDTYHIFPVGRHLLETVRYLKGLANHREMLLLDIFSELSNPERLYLSGMFHDIGKVGKDHARKGIAIARNILERLGYGKEGIEDILFLVKNHLLLVETATRRDLNDEKVVVQCARIIGDRDRLKMLYLLTWADSMATGPKAWNYWISNLVQELFFKILHALEREDLATSDASQRVKKKKAKIRRRMAGQMNQHDVELFFEVMSPRYLLNTAADDIVSHVTMVQSLDEAWKRSKFSTFLLEIKTDDPDGAWKVTFIGKDRPGLFSDIAGVMALNNINILYADIYTWRDGTAVDIFRVTGPLDPIHPQETWNKMRKDLRHSFTGKLSLAYRLSKKAEPTVLSNNKRPTHPTRVVVDNDSSDFFTLIEVFSNDRLGLLYLITHTLTNLRLDIRIAKIATMGDQVADVFYVRDLEGQKVEDKDQVEEIRKALLHQLSHPRTPTD